MYKIKSALIALTNQIKKKSRQCMFNGCTGSTINSHVLQKNGILTEIAEEQHVKELIPASVWELEKGMIFKRTGLKEAYSFPGFCSEHDSNVFKPIEGGDSDFNSTLEQALFCYRGLCHEIRRKEQSIESIEGAQRILNRKGHFASLINGYKHGIHDLTFFKQELENGIKENNFSNFIFETFKIPRIELCISVPLTISSTNFLNEESFKGYIENPLPVAFINIFPAKNHSKVIYGYHKNFPNNWLIEFVKELKTSNKETIFKEISNLITLRLEFWVMSLSLFKSIPQEKQKCWKNIFLENIYNHDPDLDTNLNLFDHL